MTFSKNDRLYDIVMLSYLKVVQKLVEPEIYNRGIKLYLDGKVLGYKELVLDYWRRYEVQGRTDLYTIDIPLLHLALDKSKYDKIDQALAQVVRSTSPYFVEFGVDSQIVAVCAALDQEFKVEKIKNSGQTKKVAEGVWDKILQAEGSKKEREWVSALEKIIYNGFSEQTKQFKDLKEMLAYIVENKAPFPPSFNEIFTSVVGDYLPEKNLLKLFTHPFFLSKGGLVWWSLIQPFFERMDIDNQIKLVEELWKNYLAGNTIKFETELLIYLKSLSLEQKNQVLESLRKSYNTEPNYWISFALQSKNMNWLDENIDQLDCRYLILAAEVLPDSREMIEQKIVKQIQIWSNFLQSGEYEEILNILKLWKDKLGRSDYYEDILGYIRANHPKKIKLIRGIEKID